MEKLSEIWIRVFGQMKTLISDQEAGVKSENSGIILSRWGVQRVLLPEGRHAGIVQRQREILRSVYHKIATGRKLFRLGQEMTHRPPWQSTRYPGLSSSSMSALDTFSLKELLGDHYLYYSWMLIDTEFVIPRTDEEDEIEIPSQLNHPVEPTPSYDEDQKDPPQTHPPVRMMMKKKMILK
eukprot:2409190-Amphidinium_carterae.1